MADNQSFYQLKLSLDGSGVDSGIQQYESKFSSFAKKLANMFDDAGKSAASSIGGKSREFEGGLDKLVGGGAKKMADFGRKAGDEFTDGLKKSIGSIGGNLFQGLFQGIGQQITTSVGGALGALKDELTGFDELRSFDFANKQLATLVGNTDSAIQVSKDLRDELNYNISSTEALAASYDVASAGFMSATDSMNILKASQKGAIGGFSDLNTVANASTSILNAYGYASDQTEKIVNQMIGTQNEGKIVVGEYAAMIGKVASTAAGAKVPLEEINGVIARATASGVRVESSFDGLRMGIASILKPSKEASDFAKEMGVEFNASALATKGLTGILAELEEKGLNSTEALIQLFGSVEAVTAIGPAAADVERLNQAIAAIESADANKAYETMAQSAEQLQKRNAILREELKLQFQSSIAPIFEAGNNALGVLLQSMQEGGVLFETLNQAAQDFNEYLKSNPETLQVIVDQIQSLAQVGLDGLASGFKAVTAALEANPDLLQTMMDKLNEGIQLAQEFGQGLADGLTVVYDAISWVAELASNLGLASGSSDSLAENAGRLVVFATVLGPVMSIASALIGMVGTIASLVTALGGISAIVSAIGGAAAAIGAFLSGPIFLALVAIAGAIVGVIELVKNWDSVTAGVGAILDSIRGLFGRIGDGINAARSRSEVFDRVWSGIASVVNGLLKPFQKIGEYIGVQIKESQVLRGIWGGIKDTMGGVKDFFGGLIEQTANWINGLKEAASLLPGMGGGDNGGDGGGHGGGGPESYIGAVLSILEAPTRQGRIDVAQVISNRAHNNFGGYGSTIKDQAFASGQFQPFFSKSQGGYGIKPGEIKDEKSAISALKKAGYSQKQAQQAIKDFFADISDTAKVAESQSKIKNFVYFNGTSQAAYKQSQDFQRSSDENFFGNGWYGDSNQYQKGSLTRMFGTGSGGIDVGMDANGLQSKILANAKAWVGKEFRPGVEAQCQEFVNHVLNSTQQGLAEAIGTTQQAVDGLESGPALASRFFGKDVSKIFKDKDQAVPGDLISFGGTYGGYGKETMTHVGVYAGNGQMIDRPTMNGPVKMRSIDTFGEGNYTFARPKAFGSAAPKSDKASPRPTSTTNTPSAPINNRLARDQTADPVMLRKAQEDAAKQESEAMQVAIESARKRDDERIKTQRAFEQEKLKQNREAQQLSLQKKIDSTSDPVAKSKLSQELKQSQTTAQYDDRILDFEQKRKDLVNARTRKTQDLGKGGAIADAARQLPDFSEQVKNYDQLIQKQKELKKLALESGGEEVAKQESEAMQRAVESARKREDETTRARRSAAQEKAKQDREAQQLLLQKKADSTSNPIAKGVFTKQLEATRTTSQYDDRILDFQQKKDDLVEARDRKKQDMTKGGDIAEAAKQLPDFSEQINAYDKLIQKQQELKQLALDGLNISENVRASEQTLAGSREAEAAARKASNDDEIRALEQRQQELEKTDQFAAKMIDYEIARKKALADTSTEIQSQAEAASDLKKTLEELAKSGITSGVEVDQLTQKLEAVRAKIVEIQKEQDDKVGLIDTREVQERLEQALKAADIRQKFSGKVEGGTIAAMRGTADLKRSAGNEFGANELDKEASIMEQQIRHREALLEIENSIRDARLQGVEISAADAAAMRATAETLNNLELEKINEQFATIGSTLKDAFQNSMSGFLKDTISGAKTMGEALKDAIGGFADKLLDLAISGLMSNLFGGMMGGGGGGILGGLFGGGGGGGLAMGLTSILGFSDGGFVPSFADGGLAGRDSVKGSPFREGSGPLAKALRREGPDGIIAVLNPGERVLNSRETKRYVELGLDRYVKGGYVPNFASGGMIPSSSASSGISSGLGQTNNISVTVPVTGGGNEKAGINVPRLTEMIRSVVQTELQRNERRGITG